MKQQSTSKKSAVCGLQSAVCPRAGFTLLELMTVMVIMFILMGMSTMALRGVMRGAGVSGAIANVRSVLTQARQEAIMKQQPTAVIFGEDPDGETRTMRVIMSFGTVANGNASGFTAENDLPWTASQLNNSKVYNFDGDEGTLSSGLNPGSYRTFGSSGISWSQGDQIALAVGSVITLPAGIAFDDLPTPPVVQFAPDGSSPGGLNMSIVELNAANSAPVLVEVDPLSGWIEVQEPGGTP